MKQTLILFLIVINIHQWERRTKFLINLLEDMINHLKIHHKVIKIMCKCNPQTWIKIIIKILYRCHRNKVTNNYYYHQIGNPEQGKNQTQEPPKQNEVKEKQSSQKPDQELIMSEEEYINKMSDYMATQHEQNPNVSPWYDHTREEYDAYVKYMLTNNPHVIIIFLFATA